MNNPAYSLWKTIHETIPYAFNTDGDSFDTFIAFTKMLLESSQFTDMFLCVHPTQPEDEYEDISQNYTAFTTWFLGRLHHFMHKANVTDNVLEIAIDCQLRILHKIKNAQPFVFNLLASEYILFLKKVSEYSGSCKTSIEVFIPTNYNRDMDFNPVYVVVATKSERDDAIKKSLKIIEYFLVDTTLVSIVDSYVFDCITSCNFILSLSIDTQIKLSIYEIFVKLLQNCGKLFPRVFLTEAFVCVTHLHETFKLIINKSVSLDASCLQQFQDIFIAFLTLKHKFNKLILDNIVDIVVNNKDNFSSQTINCCLKYGDVNLDLFDVFGDSNLAVCSTVDLQIFNEVISNIYSVENNTADIRCLSATCHKICTAIIDRLSFYYNTSENNFVEYELFLSYLRNILISLGKVKIKLIRKYGSTKYQITFIPQLDLLSKLLQSYELFSNTTQPDYKLLLDVLSHSLYLSPIEHLNITLKLILQKLYCDLNIRFDITADSFMRLPDPKVFSKSYNAILQKLKVANIDVKYILELLTRILAMCKTELITTKNKDIFGVVEKINDKLIHSWEPEYLVHLLPCLTYANSSTTNYKEFITAILNKVIQSRNKTAVEGLSVILRSTICALSRHYTIRLSFGEDQRIESSIICSHFTCAKDVVDRDTGLDCIDARITFDNYLNRKEWSAQFLSELMKYLKGARSVELKVAIIKCLPCFAGHLDEFYKMEIADTWIDFIGDSDKIIRVATNTILKQVLEYTIDNTSCNDEYKNKFFINLFDYVYENSKLSLQESCSDLQLSFLETIEQIAQVTWPDKGLKYIRLVLYFIVIRTSHHKHLAANLFMRLCKTFDSPLSLFRKHKRELCSDLIHLSVINDTLHTPYPLVESLSLIAPLFGHPSVSCLLRAAVWLFLSRLITYVGDHTTHCLLEELAAATDGDIGQLIGENYGHVFLQMTLQHDEAEAIRRFVEDVGQGRQQEWRRMHFKVIINNLLLNFYNNKTQVLSALTLLLSEYNETEFTTDDDIPNALQSYMLGVLQYFDHRLIVRGTAKKKALRSLPGIFQFIGADRLAPLKFKIIAILRSCVILNYGPYPELVCNVWDAFVRCCHIDAIAPQLATVVVSLLPLMSTAANVPNINNLFCYLIIDNALSTSAYVHHLFFLPSSSLPISADVTQAVLRHLPEAATTATVDSVAQAQYYLNGLLVQLRHETVDVRLMALQALKRFLHKCRAIMEAMIVNYNGVDGVIVDIIDILTSTCRDKDESLRLASAECIGELGAIEPSHLPRRNNGGQNGDEQFCFYADDADFIVASLNELMRAMHSEKNTQNLDRFALSIQEILRNYSISPDNKDSGHVLWQRFPEAQQQLMEPWLNSRYKIAQNFRDVPVNVAVYNSPLGGSFNTWSFNWSNKLVSSVNSKLKPLFQAYLISMQQDQRTLIHFLPQILLHAILDAPSAVDDIYSEFSAVLESIECQTKVKNTDWKELHAEDKVLCAINVNVPISDTKQSQSIKVIFVLLDYLDRWIREYEFQKMGNSASGGDNSQHDHYHQIKAFLHRFNHFQLARCNYYCGEYARALRHLEDYAETYPDRKNTVLSALAQVYAQLDESDGVTGVAALTTSAPSTEQRILTLEVSGKIVDAVACYERLPRPLTARHARGLVRCYLQLDNVDTALAVARNIMNSDVSGCDDGRLLELQAEPLWRLGRWDELEHLLNKPIFTNNDEFHINIGKALLDFQHERKESFQAVIHSMRRQIIACLAAVSLDGSTVYQHEYDRIAQLHAITELEQIERCTYDIVENPGRTKELMAALANDWQLRLKVVQETVRIREPLLCLRRAALAQSARVLAHCHPTLTSHTLPPVYSLIAHLWLESGRTARRADMSQQAFSCLLKADGDIECCIVGVGERVPPPPGLFIQKAKLHWAREECDEALMALANGIENLSSSSPTNHPILARARLLIASYNDKLSNVDTDINIRYYKAAVDAFKDWEKSLVMIGQYYDKVLSTFPEEDRDSKASEMQIHMINFFGKSLLYGCKYVHQSMPRMLSIWFDYGTVVLQEKANTGLDRRDNLLKMSKLIDASLNRLPTFVFLTAFSQLISRICHPQKEVYVQLKRIIVRLILHYPQHTLWMLIPVIKSSYSVRAKRCADILADTQLKTAPMAQLIGDFTSLAEQFIDLCNKPVGIDCQTISVASLKRSLPRMLSREDMSAIMMPTERARKMVMPVLYKREMDTYNPFPEPKVHIAAIQDEMQVKVLLCEKW